MKKFYLSLLGALFMISASAQVEGFRLDSLYQTDATGARVSKSVNEYGTDGKITTVYGYIYINGAEQLSSKSVSVLDDKGREIKDETYELQGGEYVLTGYTEYSEFDSENRATVNIGYAISDDAPAAGIQPQDKTVIKKFNGLNPEDVELYSWSGSEWVLVSTSHYDFNAKGLPVSITMTMSIMGMTMTNTGTMEYDDHGQIIKSVSSTSGIEMVQEYKNTYDNDGNLIKQSINTMGVEMTMYMFYSKIGTSNVSSQLYNIPSASQWFDLNGRRLNGKPVSKGVYINNGQKIFIK